MQIAVTGATGHLGSLIIDSLLSRRVAPGDITAIIRNEAKAATLAEKGVRVAVAPYEDVTALTAALQGTDRLVLVSGSEVGQRLAQHTNVIDAAKAAGVQFIAYTSLLNLDTSELGLAPEPAGPSSCSRTAASTTPCCATGGTGRTTPRHSTRVGPPASSSVPLGRPVSRAPHDATTPRLPPPW